MGVVRKHFQTLVAGCYVERLLGSLLRLHAPVAWLVKKNTALTVSTLSSQKAEQGNEQDKGKPQEKRSNVPKSNKTEAERQKQQRAERQRKQKSNKGQFKGNRKDKKKEPASLLSPPR